MAQLDLGPLKAEVTRDTNVKSAAATLITGLADKLDAANQVSPDEVQAVIDEMRTTTDELTTAVVAHTPVETPPAPAARR